MAHHGAVGRRGLVGKADGDRPRGRGRRTIDVLEWLLASDPAIRWQAMRDLANGSADAVRRERSRVAGHGWGAAYLAKQQRGGGWGVEHPTSFAKTPEGSAIHALMLLRAFGLDPADDRARRAVALVRDEVAHPHWGRAFFDGEVEPCINGRIVAVGAYFGEDVGGVVERLLGEQLEDGGWNCEAPPSTRASFHTTICVLEGLLEFERVHAPAAAVTEARLRGEEYLLERGMFRARSTGEAIDPAWLRFAYPHGYHYDVLRGLDHLRRAGAVPDERIAKAVEVVLRNRGEDGRWPLQTVHPDCFPCDLGEALGAPSRWVTLLAARVLRWAGADG